MLSTAPAQMSRGRYQTGVGTSGGGRCQGFEAVSSNERDAGGTAVLVLLRSSGCDWKRRQAPSPFSCLPISVSYGQNERHRRAEEQTMLLFVENLVHMLFVFVEISPPG